MSLLQTLMNVLIQGERDMSVFSDRLQNKNMCMVIRIKFLVLFCSIRMKICRIISKSVDITECNQIMVILITVEYFCIKAFGH